MKESKFSKKFIDAKNKLKEQRSVLRFFVGLVRWFATIIVVYSFTTAVIVSAIPFTTGYLAGIAQISNQTDIVTALTTWVFPSLAAVIIITILVILIDSAIYKFFKKWLNVDDMKKNAEKIEEKAAAFNGTDNKVQSFSSHKSRKLR
jgi:uncharacterized protein YpmB